MAKFKVGDRVRGVGTYDHKNIDGLLGTVKYVGPDWYAVHFDANIDGWGLSKRFIPSGHGWGVDEKHLVAAESVNKIVITTDGKTTTARLLGGKKTIKTAEAKCSPDDEFDFKTGAKIAFQRLMGEPVVEDKPEPELYNGKVVCIHSEGSWFTVGKIYTINNGELHDETVVNHLNIESIKDLNDRFDGKVKFIPIVE